MAERIRAGDRRAMARAITHLESTRDADRERGQAVLEAMIAESGHAIRVGITGPPGVGKSTLHRGPRPLPRRAGKAGRRARGRPEQSGHRRQHPRRQDPNGTPGGHGRRRSSGPRPRADRSAVWPIARERSMLLCEAAGYDVVLIETVGIGQSEVTVASMVDFFLLLLLAGGRRRAPGHQEGRRRAGRRARRQQGRWSDEGRRRADARRLRERAGADPSGAATAGDPARWPRAQSRRAASTRSGQTIVEHRRLMESTGELARRRREQSRAWMWKLVDEGSRPGLSRAARAWRKRSPAPRPTCRPRRRRRLRARALCSTASWPGDRSTEFRRTAARVRGRVSATWPAGARPADARSRGVSGTRPVAIEP